jgi:protein TonB
MFEQLVESSSKRKAGKRWMYFGVTAFGWVTVMASVVVAGVLAYDARLSDEFEVTYVLPAVMPLVKSGGPTPKTDTRRPEGFVASKDTPVDIPKQTTTLPPVDPQVGDVFLGGPGAQGGHPDGDVLGVRDGVLGAPPSYAAAPPPPQPEPKRVEPKREEVAAVPTKPIRKSEGPLQGSAIKKVEPAYPRLAVTTGTAGSVVVEVLIDERGNVVSARALSGHALLRDAAVTAARGWRWKPTTLNGVPVQVMGTITFNFIRQR